jgi:oxygen-independent coproporphyrinogen-3 oxidase
LLVETAMPSYELEQIRRFFIEVPRYTSYPTAADFTTAVGPAEHAANLRAAGAQVDAPLSLYVHLPFCREICAFCGCHALVARTEARVDRYLAALVREMDLVLCELGKARPVSELHFGGGSPSYVSAARFERLMGDLRDRFAFDGSATLSLEADPRTTDRQKLALYRSLGFERISFGFQDLDEAVQSAIGRNQTAETSREAYVLAREAGFRSINVDLCYGLPRQTEATFARTVSEVIALRPDRIALFGYAHLPQARPRQRLIVASELPDPAARLHMMADAHARLIDAGYDAIGIDHFALPDDDLARAAATGRLHRNFQGYTTTTTDTLIGLGLSAISDVPAGYAQSFRSLHAYLEAVDAGRLPTERGVHRSPDDRVRGALIRRVMCRFELDLPDIQRELNVDLRRSFAPELGELERLASDGLVAIADKRISLTPLGRVFARNVASVFDAHRGRPAPGAPPRFSTSA